jgi:Ca2+-binding RTX toxin-like protein
MVHRIGTNGPDTIIGTNANDWLEGRGGDDLLVGRARSDLLDGGTGDDLLRGDAGADTLMGRAGSDWLNGGAGRDVLDGGTEPITAGVIQDTFDFNAVSDSRAGSNRDRIMNFQFGTDETEGDKIDLSTIDADVFAGGDQDFEFGVNLWTVNSGSNTIVRADVDRDGVADFEVSVVDGSNDAFHWADIDFVL